jgi:hypothetical protein
MQGSVASLVVSSLLAVSVFAEGQAPANNAARHMRPAPVRVGRLISAPLMDDIGSFSPLPGSRLVNIIGIVQTDRGTLVPNAGTVVVRELMNGSVVGTTLVNELAQFGLRALPPGLYVAELIGRSGRVLANTPAFSAAAGELIQISQTIHEPQAEGFWRTASSATSVALSTAASSGVLALTPGVPVTPGR